MKHIILLFTLLFPVFCHAQSVINYTYDNGGNRILQTVPSSRNGGFGNSRDSEQGHTANGELAGHQVLITVYDSQGMVKVEIVGFEDSDACLASVYTTSGSLVASTSAESMPVYLDISHCRRGIYILKLVLNNETGSWKIIKR